MQGKVLEYMEYTGDNASEIHKFCCYGNPNLNPYKFTFHNESKAMIIDPVDARLHESFLIRKGVSVFQYVNNDGRKLIAALEKPFEEIVRNYVDYANGRTAAFNPEIQGEVLDCMMFKGRNWQSIAKFCKAEWQKYYSCSKVILLYKVVHEYGNVYDMCIDLNQTVFKFRVAGDERERFKVLWGPFARIVRKYLKHKRRLHNVKQSD